MAADGCAEACLVAEIVSSGASETSVGPWDEGGAVGVEVKLLELSLRGGLALDLCLLVLLALLVQQVLLVLLVKKVLLILKILLV